MKILNVEKIFSLAERSYLLDGTKDFIHVVRANKSIPYFYEELEKELKTWPCFKIAAYKKVKEGNVYVTRAHKILLKNDELLLLKPHLEKIRKSFEEVMKMTGGFSVDNFIRTNFGLCYKKHYLLKDCIEIYYFLCANRFEMTGMLPRQIPHAQSTKIIGAEALLLNIFAHAEGLKDCTWKDFYLHFELLSRSPEFRLYAPRCSWKNVMVIGLHGILSEDVIEDYNFSDLKNTLIIENLESFLPLVANNAETLLIWGSGWKCLQLSGLVNKLPQPMFYWGDIDKEGIEIAAQFCQQTGSVPVMMDQEALSKFMHLSQKIKYLTPLKKISLLNDVYDEVCQKQIRIEQEKISCDIKNFLWANDTALK